MQLIVSKKSTITLYVLYAIVLITFTIYSYALVDPNITFLNHPIWTGFRDVMVQIGYHQRPLSWYIYLSLISLLFVFHYIFFTKYKQFNVLHIAGIIGAILVFSYPFISHDLFNYMFDAKILTFYHENPYLKRALDYPQDDWIRFMHWTHRSYAYGPIFLPITLIPSFLSFGKFIIDFFLFKAMTVGFYLLAVYFLQKMNKKWAMFFATNPYVLVEGLIATHNDLISLSLAIVGIYYLLHTSEVKGRIMLFLSAGIKYITLPLLGLTKNNWMYSNYIVLLTQIALIVYVCMQKGVQQWYFLAFFAFLPFFEKFVYRLNILFAGLLISYYPYIYLGGWGKEAHVELKENIIFIFLGINCILLVFYWIKDKKNGILASK